MARREQLWNGQAVYVHVGRGRLAKATIERVHLCWHTVTCGTITLDTLRSDDELPMTMDCRHGSASWPTVCVHVRYRNNHRDRLDGAFIVPMNAIDELADLAFPVPTPTTRPPSTVEEVGDQCRPNAHDSPSVI